jgi:hypothetical protein
MDLSIRKPFNRHFTVEKYQSFLADIENRFQHKPLFRIAETPVFITPELKAELAQACEKINDVICAPDFNQKTEGAIEDRYLVPNEDKHTVFLQMDFGIVRNGDGKLFPQLIEIQGFPSLYFYQHLVAEMYRKHYDIPENLSHLTLSHEAYFDLLKKVILGDIRPENVVLLEIEPEKQVTRIDFLAAEAYLGIKTLCVSEIRKEGKDVYYIDDSGKKVPVYRIFNRVIFDELIRRTDLPREFMFTQEANVEWVGHPNWFLKISKYTLPFLKNEYVPDTWFLKDLKKIPDDLENYVLKPMFSFSGSGVVYNLDRESIQRTQDVSNYILQRKIKYEPVIETPDEPVKCEIRMLMIWEKGQQRPKIVNNLARLSKGEMIGVRYNKGKDWVGGSVGFFPITS